MSVSLRLYVVKKEKLDNPVYISPMGVFELAKRSDLFDKIEQFSIQSGVELNAPLGIDFEDQESRKDKYDDRLKHVDAESLANIIYEHDEPFREEGKFHVNDAIGEFLRTLKDDYAVVLYWC